MCELPGGLTLTLKLTLTCVSCVGEYYTSNLSEMEANYIMVLNDRSLIIIACVLHSLIVIVRSITELFLKIHKSCVTFIF